MGANQYLKLYAILLTGILLVSLFLKLDTVSAQSNPKTITVDQNGSGDYTTISTAVQAADMGDTVLVYNGIYEETAILVDKTIMLSGENPSSTIIQGDGTETLLIIQTDNMIVSGFTFSQGGDWQDASISLSSNNCYISNNIFINSSGAGISVHNSSNTTIKKNIMEGNQVSIICYDSTNIHISNNQIHDSLTGIYLYNSENILIEHNMISTCIKAVYIEESNDNTILRNHLFKNEQGMYVSYAADNMITENNFILNREDTKFATWLSPIGLQLSNWDANYYDDSTGIFPKCIPGILFIRTYAPLGIFLPWICIDWHPAQAPYAINT